jgi:predicted SnoaL-like aldol condensation-catalyzing enzyme
MTHKDIALSFLQLVSSGKIQEAYERHVAPEFRHHNPYFKGDAKSLQTGMEENESRFPGKKLRTHLAIAEGDFVSVHSHVVLKAKELELAVVHIFKIQDGKIVELWDVGQQIPKDTQNENGMF